MQTVLPHPALGTNLVYLQELFLPEDAAHFREFAAAGRPCALRGLAGHWPFVERGRFDPAVGAELRRRLGSRTCHVSFDPSSTLFSFEGGHGTSSSAEAVATEKEEASAAGPRLVNPGRAAMVFGSFLDTCEAKRHGGSASGLTVRAVNAPYDGDEQPREHGVTEAPLDVPVALLEKLALYCVEDASTWPEDVLKQFAPSDPAEDLLVPEWLPQLRERRLWMAAGGPEGVAHVTAGFHWDHMQNIHVVLSGQKEVFLVPPMEAAALQATRFCRQAQWRLEPTCGGGAEPATTPTATRIALVPMQSEESSSDYAAVGVEQDFAANAERNPQLRELRQPPRWAVLKPGDAVYIPPGWWHSVRTWRPRREERGLPFSLSVNFWYALTEEASRAHQSELLALQVLSCRSATVGRPEAHLDAFLGRSGAAAGAAAAQGPPAQLPVCDASRGAFAPVD